MRHTLEKEIKKFHYSHTHVILLLSIYKIKIPRIYIVPLIVHYNERKRQNGE